MSGEIIRPVVPLERRDVLLAILSRADRNDPLLEGDKIVKLMQGLAAVGVSGLELFDTPEKSRDAFGDALANLTYNGFITAEHQLTREGLVYAGELDERSTSEIGMFMSGIEHMRVRVNDC